MSSNRKANTFLKECMSDALIKLMETKEFSKITIHEIAEAAGVNRSTWFRNFPDKETALTFKLVQLWSRWTREHGIHGHSKYTVENAHDFLCYCYHNRQLLSLIIESNQHTAIYEAFYQIMKPQFDNNATECYQSRFYSYGLFGLLGEWNRRNYQATPEEMTAIFFDFIQ